MGQVYHNVVLPHACLRQALTEPLPTNGSGSAKVWRPCTPAMAAGLTDRMWTLHELLRYRVPPWPQPQTIYKRRHLMIVGVSGGRVLRGSPRGVNGFVKIRLAG
jgi:hypothetical protein